MSDQQNPAMRCSLSGALKNAADCIEGLMRELRDAYESNGDRLEAIEDDHQPEYYAGLLRDLAQHAEETGAGKHSVEEFATFYCLKEQP